jgi:hypothetical protein
VSRYLILVILNTPLILAGITNSFVTYKLHRTSRRRLVLRVSLWLFVLAALIFAEPIYNFLFSRGLTQTEALSLFDVIQITGIIFLFYIVSRMHAKVDQLERRTQDLHQELAIRLADIPTSTDSRR